MRFRPFLLVYGVSLLRGPALARACLWPGCDLLRLDNIDYVRAELFAAVNLAEL
jgi:hypothetical protein